MAKMNDEARTQTRQVIRHPIAWWRGAGLPEEKIRPWEGGIQLFAEGLKGFTDMRDMYYIRYEMFDYVELKTGQRSEGMTTAVDAMINKLIRDNVGNVIGNAVAQWTGFRSYVIPVGEQPKLFLDSIWPLLHVGKFVGEIFALGAYLWFKYPRDPGEVERDLVERRALAQKMKEEAEAACVT